MARAPLSDLEDKTAGLIAASDARTKGHVLAGMGIDYLDDVAASSLPVGLKLTWVLAALNTPQNLRGRAMQGALAILDSVENDITPREPSRFQHFVELKMDVLTTREHYFPKSLSIEDDAFITSDALAYFDTLLANRAVKARPGLLNTAAKACFFHVVNMRRNEGGLDKVTLARGLAYAEQGAALFIEGLQIANPRFITNQQHFWMACLHAIGGNTDAAREIVRGYFDAQGKASNPSYQYRWLQLAHVLTPTHYFNASHDRLYNFARDIEAVDSATLAELRSNKEQMPPHLLAIAAVLEKTEGKPPRHTLVSLHPDDKIVRGAEPATNGGAYYFTRIVRARPKDQKYG